METYTQDEAGQWWCQTKRQRIRATEQTCEQCGKQFPNRHPQRFCSRGCRAASQKGVLRVERTERPCAWCKKLFKPRLNAQAQMCCSKRCAYDSGNAKRGLKGKLNPNWKGGKKNHAAGYVYEWVPGRGYVLQHRLVMEQLIGRRLERYEEVHHKNGIRHDNRPENLELWAKRQPGGQRVTDLIEYARWVLATYGPVEDQLK